MIDIELPDDIRGHVERVGDFLIKNIDHLNEDDEPDQYLQEAAKIIKKRRSEILSAIREEQMT